MDSELLFGQRAIERGWLRPEQIQGCLRELTPGVRLPDLLVRKGLLTREQAIAIEGERVGKYVKDSKLGAGGMGEVWKAWDTELRRWVALKFLKNLEGDDPARFRREALTAAQLSHPGIAAVYEAGENFIAMQYIPGTTLDHVTDRRQAVELLRQAALAVHHAHQQGVIHRDLKPANIMVSDGHAYVMDFGLAKLLDVPSSISVSGTLLGTPAFMSPEQARAEAAGPRTDVYGLGATLYALVTGRPPFLGDHAYQIIGRVIVEDPPPPRANRELDVIVMKCLEKDPARRYATALELAQDLERWLKGEPILAHPPSLVYRIGRKLARHAAWTVATLVVLLAGAAYFATTVVRKNRRIEELLVKARRDNDRDAYRAVLELDPSNREARDGVERIDAVRREVAGLQEAARSALDTAFRHYYEPQYRYEELMRRVQRARGPIDRALELDPRSPVTITLQGWAVELEGEEDLAIERYRAALEIDPSYAQARYRLGRALIERGFLASFVVDEDIAPSAAILREGQEELERSRGRSGHEDRVKQEIAIGLLAYIQQNWDRLREIAARGIREFDGADGVEEFHWLAGLGAPTEKERVEHYDRAIAIRPRFLLALFSRAAARRKLGNVRGAIEDYTTVLSMRPKLPFAYLNRGEARMSSGDAEGALADATDALTYGRDIFIAHVNRAAANLRLGRMDDALADAESAVRLRPGSFRTWSVLGGVKYARKDYVGAVEACTKAIELKSTVAEPYYNRGCARLALREFALAEEDFLSALQLRGPDAQLLCCIGEARNGRRDFAAALRAYDEAARRDPKSADAQAGRAESLRSLENANEALAAITKAIDLQPRATFFAYRGDLHLEAKRDREAEADLTEALRRGQGDARTYYQRAYARQGLGDHAGAESDLDAVLRLEPGNLEALFNRAATRVARGNVAGGIEDLTALISKDPKNARAFLHRAGLRLRSDEIEDAARDAEAAVRLAPADPEAYIARGNVRAARDDVRGQIADYQKALEVAPNNWPMRAQVEEALKRLTQ